MDFVLDATILSSEQDCCKDLSRIWSNVQTRPSTFTEISDESLSIWRSFIKLLGLTGEAYFVFQVLLNMAFPLPAQKPLLLQMHVSAPLLGSMIVRFMSWKLPKLTYEQIQVVATVFNAFAIVTRLDLPKHLLPSNFLGRAFIGVWSANPKRLVVMNLLCEPLAFAVQWHQHQLNELSGSESKVDLVRAIFNEAFCMLLMNVMILHFSAVFQKQEIATKKLEEEIAAKEKIVTETQVLFDAARRLLSVTCDCLVQLSHDWKLKEPDRSVKDMLRLGSRMTAELHFAEFISPEDHERFSTFIRTSRDSTSPSSLHLKMQDMRGSPFHAQLFHVEIPTLTDLSGEAVNLPKEHLLGLIRQELKEPAEEDSVGGCSPIPEGQPLKCSSAGSSVSSRRTDRKAKEDGRRKHGQESAKPKEGSLKLDKVKLTIDLNTTQHGYAIRSISVNLLENCPDFSFLKFVKRKYRPLVEDWIQEHMNCWMMQCSCDESCLGCQLQLDGRDVLVREMKVLSIDQLPSGVDSKDLGYTLLMTVELNNFLNMA